MTGTAHEMATTAAIDQVELMDGTVVDVHPMEPGDASALRRFHETLSDDTTYLRFFTIHPELSLDEVIRFTQVDHRDREALVGVVGGELVAVARFDRLEDGHSAEVAFVVADHLQGLGLGAELFHLLVDRGRRVGIRQFVAETLPRNRRMLGLFRSCGLRSTTTVADATAHVIIDLDN